MSLLAKRYASALFALANEKGAADAVAADLVWLGEAIASPAASELLTSPYVTEAEREQVLQKLSAGRHPLVSNLIGVLQHRRRLAVLPDLPAAFRVLLMAQRGEADGTAESAHPLSAEDLKALSALAGRLSGKQVHLSAQERPELIGGVRLRIGNVLYDGSLRSALDQLEAQLQKSNV